MSVREPKWEVIGELVAVDDWAGLVRFSIAMGLDQEALQAAVAAAERTSPGELGQQSWLLEQLKRFQQHATDPREQVDEPYEGEWTEAELATLNIMRLFPLAVLCEFAAQFPPAQQDEAFALGRQAAQVCVMLAAQSDDAGLRATLTVIIARSFQEQNQLEAARKAYDEALGIRRELAEQRPDVYRPNVALTLNNLGNVLRNLNQLEAARQAYEEALGIRRELAEQRPDVYRPNVALTLNNLGNVLSDLNQLEAARQAYDEALGIRRELAEQRPDVYRPDVAMALNNLGNVLSDLNQLESARQAYDEALEIYRELAEQRPDVYRPDVAMTLNNLGTVLSDLNQLEAAQKAYEEALEDYRELIRERPDVYRPYVAGTLNNLGTVLRNLNQLEAARQAYEEALGIRRELAEQRPDVYRPYVAGTLNNLGTVLSHLNQLEAARKAYNKALEIYRELAEQRPDVYRPDVAMTLNNLGTVLSDLNQLEAARQAYEEALGIRRELAEQRPDVYRPDVAMTLNNLGNVLSDLNQLEAARQAYDQAARLYQQDAERQPTAQLNERMTVYRSLGQTLLRDFKRTQQVSDLHESHGWLREARQAGEMFRGMFQDYRQRRRIQGTLLGTYETLIRTCHELWKQDHSNNAPLQEAVEVAEAGRARTLMELLADETLESAKTPPELLDELRTLRRDLRQTLEMLHEAELQTAPAPGQRTADVPAPQSRTERPLAEHATERRMRSPALLRELSQLAGNPQERVESLQNKFASLDEEYQDCLRRIQEHDPEFDPDQPVPPVSAEQAQEIIPNRETALVQFTLTEQAGLALILTQERIIPVELPECTSDSVFQLALEWFQGYYTGRLSREAWNAHLESALATLSAWVLHPLLAHIPEGVSTLILSPNRALHIFPLHACPLGESDQRLCDLYEVHFTPSLSILHRCVQRERQRTSELLSIDIPSDLLFRDPELYRVEQQFAPRVNRILHGASVKQDVLAQSPESHVWHYPGHCSFNIETPLQSALLFGEADESERWLTLRDVFVGLHLPQTRLAVLSACESGMLRPDTLDEYVGFPTAFLYAGATCVINSLWKVGDLPTCLLIDRFYQNWKGGLSIGTALRQAQNWLRGKPDHKGEALTNGAALADYVLDSDFLVRIKDTTIQKRCRGTVQAIAQAHPDGSSVSGCGYLGFSCFGSGG